MSRELQAAISDWACFSTNVGTVLFFQDIYNVAARLFPLLNSRVTPLVDAALHEWSDTRLGGILFRLKEYG